MLPLAQSVIHDGLRLGQNLFAQIWCVRQRLLTEPAQDFRNSRRHSRLEPPQYSFRLVKVGKRCAPNVHDCGRNDVQILIRSVCPMKGQRYYDLIECDVGSVAYRIS